MANSLIETDLPSCRNCGHQLVLDEQDEDFVGNCPQCGELVCYECGCTQKHACVRKCVDGVLVCGWASVGCCTFCRWALIEQAYQIALGQETIISGVY